MKLIETLSDKIAEEIHDAKSYAKMALEQREKNPELSRTLYTISLEEMDHMNRLHNSVVGVIESYRKEHGEPPAAMMAVYDYLHRKQIDNAADVKALQDLYK